MKRLLVVDDVPLFRAGLASALRDAGFEVVAEAGGAEAAVTAAEEHQPDLVLLDILMPGISGLEVVEKISAVAPGAHVVLLTASESEEDLLVGVKAGARGYVTKSIKGPELVESVLRVADGDAVFSPRLAGFVIDAFSATAVEPADPELDQLSPREKEVMRLLARGYAYKEIARRLSISVKTVETHASAVLRKLQFSSRNELQNWAARRRIV